MKNKDFRTDGISSSPALRYIVGLKTCAAILQQMDDVSYTKRFVIQTKVPTDQQQ